MKGKLRKGIFAIVYSFDKNILKYLILKRKLHWKGWEFVKGKIELFETKKMAVVREVKEEAGIKIKKIKKHEFSGKFLYKKPLKDRPGIVGQTFTLYSAQMKKGKVKVDPIEHSEFKWMSYKNTLKNLTYKNQKESLKVVNDWLLEKFK
ncbi:hypothetical protein COU58_03910 [Candidatus Pacearchaeota archaeon CG10_big_fil_rev_8_21_14_0_10_32_42]|nr:MAG: hypothetical protein COU58_03910 [Candidatus Pacearchaeota archaeon CG10_big_fil_rev_8_21_14_0_10_32_42]